ncbi:lupus la protein [Anaeramoeba flamelloides]|uniref:Lupus la protein n=1 Tax=Anaeramoeba flamelloides TaxID=1746091 RepID=A0AAV8A739_9EUKA|nr:lupus la protein [Anaeramoeba flamelloides]
MGNKAQRELAKKIKDQIELYFSDSALSRDRFLKGLIEKNEEGYVSFLDLLRFNRLREISEDIELIAKSLEKSETLELSEDKKSVRRKVPLPEDFSDDHLTVFCRNLPKEIQIDDLKTFFSKYGTVNYVRLLRSNRKPNGSANIIFSTEEEAKNVCDQVINYKGKLIFAMLINEFKQALKTQRQKKKPSRGNVRRSSLPIEDGLEILKSSVKGGSVLKISGFEEEPDQKKLTKSFQNAGKIQKIIWEDSFSYIVFFEPINDKIKDGASVKLGELSTSAWTKEEAEETVELKILDGEEEGNFLLNILSHKRKKRRRKIKDLQEKLNTPKPIPRKKK